MLGHLALLGAHRPVVPLASGGAPEGRVGAAVAELLADWADRCHAEGGLVVGAHFPLPLAEIATAVVTGRIDAIEMQTFAPGLDNPTVLEWYRFLNCGYRLPVLGGTDKMSAEMALGGVRTYARLDPDEPPTFDAWARAVRAGRTLASSGPVLTLAVDGHEPGAIVTLPAGGGRLEVRASAAAAQPIIGRRGGRQRPGASRRRAGRTADRPSSSRRPSAVTQAPGSRSRARSEREIVLGVPNQHGRPLVAGVRRRRGPPAVRAARRSGDPGRDRWNRSLARGHCRRSPMPPTVRAWPAVLRSRPPASVARLGVNPGGPSVKIAPRPVHAPRPSLRRGLPDRAPTSATTRSSCRRARTSSRSSPHPRADRAKVAEFRAALERPRAWSSRRSSRSTAGRARTRTSARPLSATGSGRSSSRRAPLHDHELGVQRASRAGRPERGPVLALDGGAPSDLRARGHPAQPRSPSRTISSRRTRRRSTSSAGSTRRPSATSSACRTRTTLATTSRR